LPIRHFKISLVAFFFIFVCSVCSREARAQGVAPDSPPAVGSGTVKAVAGPAAPRADLERTGRELQELALAQAQAKAEPGQEVDRLKAQVELQQKQIDVLLRMAQLLAGEVKKQPATEEALEKLQEQAVANEAQVQQGAQRDLETAQARDQLAEQTDANFRNERPLPATLREIFSPFRNNESPLTIYGSVAQAFDAFSQQNTSFRAQTLELRPYLLLNEKWLMSANVALQQGTVQLWRAQAERFINDNYTLVFGRFYSPIGFYSERLRLNWIIKTPDPPLMFNQVYPAQLSFDGIQLRGARYVANTPVKLEYSGFVANGLSVTGSKLSPGIYSNLNNFTDSGSDVNGAKAYGGRIGMSIPEIGLIAGLSGLANQAYDSAGQTLTLWDVDVNFHRGNWDARFELTNTAQQTPAPAASIRRFGYYGQVAYRQYDNPNRYLQKLEGVARFDHVEFDGINLQQTGINFGGLGLNYARQPLDRNRFTIGVNYWFYASLVMKLAIEFNDELHVPSLRDNGFIGQLVWGF
jgi:hypothetical protein